MATPNLPVLYEFWRSSCAWRVRLALKLKGIAYESRTVDLLTEENISPEYKQIQPFGAIPAFIDDRGDGRILCESVAILEYLEETRPEIPLLPKDPAERAIVRSLVLAVGMDIQPICQTRVRKYLGKEVTPGWVKHWMDEGFAALEKMVEKTAGKYSFGDTITMADVMIIPQCTFGVAYGVDLASFPTLHRISTTLDELEIFKEAHPSSQPGFVAELL